MSTSIAVQTFTASGTYTPTANMQSCIVICIGGGGGGAASTATDEASGGGGGGATAIKCFQAAEIGTSQAVTIGAQVASDTSGETSGFGTANALLQSTGGTTNQTGTGTFSVVLSCAGGDGGTATLGDLNIKGEAGGRGIIFSGANGMGGDGGSSIFGGRGASGGNNSTGLIGGLYGGGGGGANATATGNIAGGLGAAGVVYIIEFIDTDSPIVSLNNSLRAVMIPILVR